MNNQQPRNRIAYFISPHGFGHAARAAAVMLSLQDHLPEVHFDIFTRIPEWFFEESLLRNYTCHDVLTDVGLVQSTPMVEDLTATLDMLGKFIPFDQHILDLLCAQLYALGTRLVICDISPLGIAVAQQAHIQSILIENFTWDWIYEGYLPNEIGFNRFIPFLQELFAASTYHIQTAPICRPVVKHDLLTLPVSRKPNITPDQIREALHIPDHQPMVLITMGGIPDRYSFLQQLTKLSSISFVIPGSVPAIEHSKNLILLPHHSNFYHPNLIHTCDTAIGKAGYSTIAEAYAAGVPFGYVCRPGFRESGPLTDFIRREMKGMEITPNDFESGAWIDQLSWLLTLPRIQRPGPNGADQISRFLISLL